MLIVTVSSLAVGRASLAIARDSAATATAAKMACRVISLERPYKHLDDESRPGFGPRPALKQANAHNGQRRGVPDARTTRGPGGRRAAAVGGAEAKSAAGV